jgi:hypothetical protein
MLTKPPKAFDWKWTPAHDWLGGKANGREAVAVVFARIVTLWAQIEAQETILWRVAIGQPDSALVAELVNKTKTGSSMRATLRKHIESCLSQPAGSVAKSVLGFISECKERRDNLVHGVVGFSDSLPDGLLLLSSEHAQALGAEAVQKLSTGEEMKDAWSTRARDLRYASVTDLEAFAGRLHDLYWAISWTLMLTSNATEHPTYRWAAEELQKKGYDLRAA